MIDNDRRWLVIWCWAAIAFGAVIAGASFPATEGPARTLLEWQGGRGVAPDAALRFALGLTGAVTIGWGATLLALVGAGERLGAVAWRKVAGAVALWFAVDSALSVANGFAPNVASNLVFLAGFLIALRASGFARGDAARRPLTT